MKSGTEEPSPRPTCNLWIVYYRTTGLLIASACIDNLKEVFTGKKFVSLVVVCVILALSIGAIAHAIGRGDGT